MTKYQQSLILHNMDYASKLALGFAKKTEWFDDLRAEAWLALSLCAKKYNPRNEQDACFVTFCTPYIKGKLAQYVMREYRGAFLDKHERKLAKIVSMDEQIGDDEDPYTIGETIASSSYDEWQHDSNVVDVLGQILASLNKSELEIYKACFVSPETKASMIKLADKRKVSVGKLKYEADMLFKKMCDIAESKKLTF